ncbi:MAG: hypothetical protein R2867_36380 [Caldilineaceae bacterium]
MQINPASMHWVWLLPLGMASVTQFVLDWRQIMRGGKGLGGKIKAAITGYWRKVYALFYDQVCFLHEAGAQKLLGRHWQQKGRIVPLAVDEQFLAAQTPDVVDESDDGQGTIRFLYVGSLSRVRQLERLIEAAELLAAQSGFSTAFDWARQCRRLLSADYCAKGSSKTGGGIACCTLCADSANSSII